MDEELCSIGGNQANNWLGGEINLNQNGEKIATLPYGFTNFEYCVGASHDDEFQLQATNDDGVCITSLAINNNQLLVGKDENQESFWMNQKLPKCSNDQMTTSQLTIQNGNIVSSECVEQNSIIVHEGWIIDGISIDGELFGRNHKNKKEINLGGDEKVIAIDYSLYDGTSFTDTNLDNTICRLTIKTNYDSYGPYSVPSLGCEEKVESVIVPSNLSLKDFFETFSTTTKHEGFFTFTPGVPMTTN